MAGFDKLEARLGELTKRVAEPRHVRVGFAEDATGQDGQPIATRAVVNNFGAPSQGIPPRPFFSNMVAEEGPKLPDRMARVLEAADYDVDVALERMGDGLKRALVQSITSGSYTALAPATIARKGGVTLSTKAGKLFGKDAPAGGTSPYGPAKPLVETGDMLNAVSSTLAGGADE